MTGNKKNIALHTCCAPCTAYVLPAFQAEGFEVIPVFFNPNIHPFNEYVQRVRSMNELLQRWKKPFTQPFPHEPVRFFSAISGQDDRCQICYRLRLEQIAGWAKEKGINYFSTTLTISPYQDVEKINQIGERMGQQYRVSYLAKDFRAGFTESKKMAQEYGLYRQKYCGCLYSFWEGAKRTTWKALNGADTS